MNTKEIMQKTNDHVLGTYARVPVAFVRGEGSYLWDAEGKRYLDFLSGIAVNALGHSHPRIIKVLSQQASQLIHVSNLFYHPSQALLAEKLCEISFADKVFFCNSGAEANEAALKLARAYGKAKRGEDCYEVISLERSFHGRTLATVAATGQEKVKKGFAPLPSGFFQVPSEDLQSLKKAINAKTCAVLLEPVQGEGGVYPLDSSYLEAVFQLCQERDLLFMVDEIQSGLGRTGRLFAHEHAAVNPQIMTLAKPLGAGLPLGACLCTQEVADVIWAGAHGSTYGGNALVSQVALEFLKILTEEGLLEQARQKGAFLQKGLQNLANHCAAVDHVRGLGLMAGIALKVTSKPVMEEALKEGLIINAVQEKALRLLPPLTISEEEIEEALGILEKILMKH